VAFVLLVFILCVVVFVFLVVILCDVVFVLLWPMLPAFLDCPFQSNHFGYV
jgi:hypothetical protein